MSQRPCHILHVVPGLAPGGMEIAMARVIRNLAGCGTQHSIVCLKGEPRIRDQIPADVPVYCMNARPNEPALPWRLWRLILRVRPSVIHARNWGAWPDIAVARLAMWPPVPLIFSFHGFARPDRPPLRRRLAFRVLARVTTCLFTVSEASRRMLIDELGWPSNRVLVIPNGVDTDRFTPGPAHSPASERVIFGTVGSLTPVKDHALLIRACAELMESGLPCEVRIAGEGPERPHLETLARSLGVSERVCFMGHVKDVPQFLRGLSVFVLPSRSEAHPNALLEAMACGLPCVATRVGGIGEVLRDGRDGRLVKPGDPEALVQALTELVDNPAARQAFGSAGRERVYEHYSLQAMIQAYADLYDRVSRKGRGPECPHAARSAVHRKRRVLMLGPLPPLTGGMATVTDNLRRSALARECRLVVLNNGKTTPEGRSFLTGIKAQVRLLGRLAGMILKHRAEIVHIHTIQFFGFWRDCVHLAVARLLGCRVFLHNHGASFDQWAAGMGPLARGILRWSFESASGVIVLSRDWLTKLAPYAPRARWHVVPNGVPLPPRVNDVTTSPPVFLFLGDWTSRKGVHDLVGAVELASRQGFAGIVRLAGFEKEPGQLKALEQRIAAGGCASRIRILGTLAASEKDAALAAAHCLVLPSYAEGLPMAVLEAMAYGLPVIASRVGAVPEAMTDGQEGFIIAPGDVEALTDRMLRLTRNLELRRQMGAAARRRAETEFSLDVIVDRLMRIYGEVLSASDERNDTAPVI